MLRVVWSSLSAGSLSVEVNSDDEPVQTQDLYREQMHQLGGVKVNISSQRE